MFTSPLAKHEYTRYDVCAWCKRSRAYNESYPSTPYCWKAPESEVKKVRARMKMDEAAGQACKRGTFA